MFQVHYFDQNTGLWHILHFNDNLEALNKCGELYGNKLIGFMAKVTGNRPCDKKRGFTWNHTL